MKLTSLFRAPIMLLCAPLLLVLSGCTARYVVLEPESPVDRLRSRVIADIVTATPRGGEPVLLTRVHAIAPRDSSLLLILRAVEGDLPSRLQPLVREVLQDQSSQSLVGGTRCDKAAPSAYFVTICTVGGNEPFPSTSHLAYARLRHPSGRLGVNPPDSVLKASPSYIVVPAGRDTSFTLVTEVKDPQFDVEHTRYGMQLTWRTIPVAFNAGIVDIRTRHLYLRASFRHVSYGLIPVWFLAALGIIHASTLK